MERKIPHVPVHSRFSFLAVGMVILVTGAAGYIGSHACLALLEAGHRVVALDNYSNSSPESIRRVHQLSGKTLAMEVGDLLDVPFLNEVFTRHAIDGVMHFAGLKAVAESVREPLRYFQNNVEGSINLFDVMEAAEVSRLIFSSSATVYGEPAEVPVTEASAIQPTNPYGHTKAMIEVILQELAEKPGSQWQVALLRYFNPVGAHPSGQIGEDPRGTPNNLLPYISQVAVGQLEEVAVFGNDYPTVDGTGVRDYIHVMDLVEGHLAALDWLAKQPRPCAEVFNLGTGQGYSVLQVIRAFEEASGQPVPYRVVGRRAGDIATCYAHAAKAGRSLDWRAKRGLAEMMTDAWCWQKNNPQGYKH